MTHAEKAKALFQQGFNCSQSVFLAFEDVYSLDRNTALKLSAPFGAGMGMMREVCGCVSGMLLVLGILEGYSDPADQNRKKELYLRVQALAKEFQAGCGSILCRDLLGLKKGEISKEPSVRTEEYYKKRPCAEMCRVAAQLLDDYFDQKG